MLFRSPFGDFAGDIVAQHFGRSAGGLHVEYVELMAAEVGHEVAVNGRVEFLDDLPRRAGRRQDAVPGDRFEAGEAQFVHGRDIRKLLRAFGRGDGDAAQRAVVHKLDQARREIDADVDLPAQEVGIDIDAAATAPSTTPGQA